MTEAEWLETPALLELIRMTDPATVKRKLPYFELAVFQHRPDLMTDAMGEYAAALEQFLSEPGSDAAPPDYSEELLEEVNEQLAQEISAADEAYYATLWDVCNQAWAQAIEDVVDVVDEDNPIIEAREPYVALARDVFGNPFRKVKFKKAWRTDTVVAIAHQMVDSRDFSAMPILADALQDADCDNADVLRHCRRGPHVRGCWLMDLILSTAQRSS